MRGRATATLVLLVPLLVVSTIRPLSAQEAQETSESEGKKKSESEAESVDELAPKKKEKLLELLETARNDYMKGNFEDVVPKMKRAYEMHPDPDFLFRIGLSHERMGNTEEAIRYYERFLEEKPDAKKRGRVERSLEMLRDRVANEPEQEQTRKESPSTDPDDEQSAPDEADEEPATETAVEKSETGDADRGTSPPTESDDDAPASASPGSRTLPIALTAAGAALAGGSITFTVLNLQTKSDVESIRSNPDEYPNVTDEEFERKVQRQNLYAGLAIGTGVAAAGTLTWAVLEWMKGPESGGASSANGDGASRTSGPIRFRIQLQPARVIVSADF